MKTNIARHGAFKNASLFEMMTGISLVSAALSAMHAVNTHSFSIAFFFSLLVVLSISLFTGMLLVNILGISEQDGIDFITALLVGMIFLDVILLAFAFTLPFGMTGDMMVILVCIGVFVWCKPGWRIFHQSLKTMYLDKIGLCALFVTLVASGLWSTENLQGFSFPSPGIIEIHPWIDVCLTARQISLFMNSSGASSLSSIYMWGYHLPIYHYGSYMIPALLGSLSGVSSFSLTTATLAPLGFIWTGLAAYITGKIIFGRHAGLVAVIGLLLMPDASYIGLGNRWSGYFFFQQVGMGGGYAVSALAVAWAYVIEAIRKNSIRFLIISLSFCAISAVFKVTITVVYIIPLLIFMAVYFRSVDWKIRGGALFCAGIAYCLTLQFIREIPNAPTLQFSTKGAYLNLSTLIGFFKPDRAQWLMNLLKMSSSYYWQLLFGIPLILLATYGVWIFVLPFVLGYISRLHYSPCIVVMPLLIILSHLVIALCLAPNSSVVNDYYEVIHKTFVWPYFLITVCCSSILGMSMTINGKKYSAGVKIGLGVFVILGFCWVSVMAKTTQTGFSLAEGYTNLKFPRGLYEAAEYVRRFTPKNAIVQYSDNDDYCMVTGFCERYPYVLHLTVNRGKVSEIEKRRFATVENILNQQDIASVRKTAEAAGIDWFIVSNQRKLRWRNQAGVSPAFQYDGFCVYNMKQ